MPWGDNDLDFLLAVKFFVWALKYLDFRSNCIIILRSLIIDNYRRGRCHDYRLQRGLLHQINGLLATEAFSIATLTFNYLLLSTIRLLIRHLDLQLVSGPEVSCLARRSRLLQEQLISRL